MAFTGFYIDGVKIKDPNEFDEEYYTLTQSTRIANGDMTMDFVANKRKYNFKWNAISSRQLETLVEFVRRVGVAVLSILGKYLEYFCNAFLVCFSRLCMVAEAVFGQYLESIWIFLRKYLKVF